METWEKEILVNRIIAGIHRIEIDEKYYIVRNINSSLKYKASQFVAKLINEWAFDILFKEKYCSGTLIGLGHLPRDFKTDAKKLEKQIEETKIGIFKAFLRPKEKVQLKNSLNKFRKQQMFLFNAEHSLDHVTLEGAARAVAYRWTVENSIFDDDGNKVEPNYVLVEKIINGLSNEHVSHDTLREVSRTEPWRLFWTTGKPNPFGISSLDWTEEQRILVNFSKMYDSIYEHPDCPSDDIIDDDDALDGWLLIQQREREKDRVDKQVDNMLGNKHKGAGEIFVPVGSPEEAALVHQRNDGVTRAILQARNKQIEAQGQVAEKDLVAIKQTTSFRSSRDG